jgi:hypothetical protein
VEEAEAIGGGSMNAIGSMTDLSIAISTDAEAVAAFRCSHCRVTRCWKEPKEVQISWEEWVISWMMMSISSGRISSWMDLV